MVMLQGNDNVESVISRSVPFILTINIILLQDLVHVRNDKALYKLVNKIH